MTVGEKSTQIGYDLGQKILDTGVVISKHTSATSSSFLCYRIEGPIPPDTNQNGSTQNFYYFDSSRIQTDGSATQSIIDVCASWGGTESRVEIETQYLAWMTEQPYDEIQLPNQVNIL